MNVNRLGLLNGKEITFQGTYFLRLNFVLVNMSIPCTAYRVEHGSTGGGFCYY
jgi:hypothetical protein